MANSVLIRKTAFSLCVLLFLSGIAAAAENLHFPWIYRPLTPYINSELSWLAKQLYGSERVNVYDLENKPIASVGTLSGRLNQLNETLWARPTVNVYISDQKLVSRVVEATDRRDQLGKELSSGRLKVEPLTFGGKLRFALVKLLANQL